MTADDRYVRTTAGGTITLLAIADVANANRLAAGQKLTFARTGMTVVYGDNGTGKSGYARILKRSCRTRFSTAVLPNELDTTSTKGAAATIAYADEGRDCPPIAWNDSDTPNHILSAISVFDRESGAVHVREQNEVAFRPFGLDIPDDLAAACTGVKDALTAEQTRLNAARDALFSQPTSPLKRRLTRRSCRQSAARRGERCGTRRGRMRRRMHCPSNHFRRSPKASHASCVSSRSMLRRCAPPLVRRDRD